MPDPAPPVPGSRAAAQAGVAALVRLPAPHGQAGGEHHPGLEHVRHVHPAGGRAAQRAHAERVPRPQPPPHHRPAPRGHGRRGDRAGRRREPRFNLIVTAVNVGDMDAAELARKVKEAGLDIPVVLLAYDGGELAEFMAHHDTCRPGAHLPVAGRLPHPAGHHQVRGRQAERGLRHGRGRRAGDPAHRGQHPLLLLVPAHSSTPRSSTTRSTLITEGVNVAHKILRMRARPKILLCTSFEEAWEYFSAYQEDVLGVISDIEFPQEGRLDPQAGRRVRPQGQGRVPDIPVLLQSSRPESEALAREVGADFLLEGLAHASRTTCARFIVDNFAFGDFIFRLPDGTEVGRASDLKSLLGAAARPCLPSRSPTTPSATTSPAGSRPAPSSTWPTTSARERPPTTPPSRTGGSTSSRRSTPTGASRPGNR